MLGAVSSTDGVLESDDAEGWYTRDTGVGGLWIGYNGKPGSRANVDSVVSGLRRAMCECSASPASRRKSTMFASAACCLPASAAVMLAPSAAAVLLAPDMEETDSNERLLEPARDMSMEEDGRKQKTKERGTHGM